MEKLIEAISQVFGLVVNGIDDQSSKVQLCLMQEMVQLSMKDCLLVGCACQLGSLRQAAEGRGRSRG